MNNPTQTDIPEGIFTEADRIAKLTGLPDASAVLIQCFVLCKQHYLQRLGLAEPMKRDPQRWRTAQEVVPIHELDLKAENAIGAEVIFHRGEWQRVSALTEEKKTMIAQAVDAGEKLFEQQERGANVLNLAEFNLLIQGPMPTDTPQFSTTITPDQSVNYTDGGRVAITLPDGSRLSIDTDWEERAHCFTLHGLSYG